MSVSLKSHEHQGVLTIEISGPMTTVDESLQGTILKRLEAGNRHFIIDMADVPSIDSAGLGQLIFAYTAVKKANGTMQLLPPNKRVRERLRITQLDTVLEILEDEAAA